MPDHDQSLWAWLASAIGLYVQPLRQAAQAGPEALSGLLEKATGSAHQDTLDAITTFTAVTQSFVVSEPEVITSIDQLVDVVKPLLDAWTDLKNALESEGPALFEYLTMQWIWNSGPAVYSFLALLDVINEENQPGQRIQPDNIKYLWRPKQLLPDVYRWNSDFSSQLFLRRVATLGRVLGAPISISAPSDAAINDLGLLDPVTGEVTSVLIVPVLRINNADVWFAAGFNVAGVPGPPERAAVTIVPFGAGGFPAGSISPSWTVTFKAGGLEGFGISFRPPNRVEPVRIAGASGQPVVEVTLERDRQHPWRLLLGGDFRLTAQQAQLHITTDVESTFNVNLSVVGFEVKIGGSDDGFLSKILPKDGLTASSDFTLTWSPDDGLRFEGGLGFAVSIPLHLALGPLALSKLAITIVLAESPVVTAEARVDVCVQLGPVQASIAGVGLSGEFDLIRHTETTNDGAQLGPLRARVGFLAPTGAGLAVNAGAVTGGGFIDHEEALHRYTGILNLKFSEIGLVAVAIITTKLPGNKPGFALFINIGVTFSPPITLPYNFNLRGCGGLLALNRTMDVEALRSGLKTGTLNSILFPANPIANAAKIIADSERVFPIEEGRFVVGPMAKLGWGANGMIIANIAIVIELPSPIVIAVLGQLIAKIPKPEQAKVVIHLDVLGVLDVAKKSLSIDATLYDSKILTYSLWGDSALRLTWGSQPVFGMSLGGWHPKFTPPPNFPKLRRLTLQLSSSSSFELACTVYQALTSNTVQFGAGITLHAEACGADVDGSLSMDTLISFSPFEFEVEISGKIDASYHGHDVASIRLDLDLSGPTPWHAKGRAKFSVAWWDVCVHFSKTWGSDEKAMLPSIDPRCDFLTEIQNVTNWNGALLSRRTAVESLKSIEPTPDDTLPALLVHPAGSLEVRQRLIPLQTYLDKFANADVTAP